MASQNPVDLYDPRQGGQAIRIDSLRLDGKPNEPARTNYFAIYFIESGSGSFWADASWFSDPRLFLSRENQNHLGAL
jgi:hypothetical protein